MADVSSFRSGSSTAEVAAARLLRRTVRQWRLVLASAILFAVVGTVLASLRTDEYEATTVVQLNTVDLQSVFLDQNVQQQGDDAATKTATNAKLVTFPRVREVASRALGGGITADQLDTAVRVDPEPGTTLVNIVARDTDPRTAARIADAMREAFIEVRRQTALVQLNSATTDLERQLAAIPSADSGSQSAIQLRERLRELSTLRAVTNGGVDAVQTARVPGEPIGGSTKRYAVLALLLGGLFGSAVAFLRARFDPRIREPDELTELWELPVLGLIPGSSHLKLSERAPGSAPAGAMLEAFALARTNLRYLHVGGEVKTVVVTSALEGEGKSTVAWNLAVASAQAGSTVLLIEADLRRPVLARRLGLRSQSGLSEILAGISPVADAAVQRVDCGGAGALDAYVDVLPAGQVPPSPVALLERPILGDLLAQAGDKYDLVLVDTPPATVVADAKVVLSSADGVVIVSRIGRVTRPSFERLKNLLLGDAGTVLGLIVNDVSHSSAEYSSSYYDGPTAPVESAPLSTPDPSDSTKKPAERSSRGSRPRNLTRS